MRLARLLLRSSPVAAALGVMIGLSLPAQAAPQLQGAFSIAGSVTSGGQPLTTAVSLSFAGITVAGPGSGSFLALLASGDAVTMLTIADLTMLDIPNFLTVDNVIFSLTGGTVAIGTDVVNGHAIGTHLMLDGSGVFTVSGGAYADTQGGIILTANSNDQGTSLSVSATLPATPTAVPEPVSLVLLGSGLLALGVVRRRRS